MSHDAAAQGVSLPWSQSGWVKTHGAAARLVGGTRQGKDGGRRIVAGVEIQMEKGWKTYWRKPGDSGGVAPAFAWTGSGNVAGVRVLYPAPHRIKDPTGQTIGYKNRVVFPVEITPRQTARSVKLALQLAYGVCREICVPAEASIELTIDPSHAALPPQLSAALAAVPAADDRNKPSDPQLKAANAVLSGKSPRLVFDIAAPAAAPITDLFVEAPPGLYLPMTEKTGTPSGGVQRFTIDLKGVEDLARFRGQTLRLTVIGAQGGVEQRWTVK